MAVNLDPTADILGLNVPLSASLLPGSFLLKQDQAVQSQLTYYCASDLLPTIPYTQHNQGISEYQFNALEVF